jgi:GntR family transcriptional regulator / MocR family aminotransferase
MRTPASPSIVAHLPVRKGTGIPLHQQIYAGLQRAILDGLIRPGQRVPSTRELAAELGVSRLPVLSAYDQLLHEGYLEGRAGSGTFVSGALPDDSHRPAVPARHRPRRASGAARAPRQLAARYEGGLRPFRMSLPALDHFPQRIWTRLVTRHAHLLSPANMAYGDPAGVPALRSAIGEYLRTARAVRCEPEQVLIVSGSQAALRLCASVLLSPGDLAAVEDPGYPGARTAFAAEGVKPAPVRVDDEGLDVDALDALGKPVRAVYITPSHQYPLGSSMSASRRLELLDWARRRQAWVIEDDYDSEYRYVSRPLAALQGLSANARVVYIGTFSKVLFPAIRVGYLIVPAALRDAFLAARESLDVFSPTLYQLVLADFIRDGHFARHLRRMRLLYLRRRNALLDGLDRYCSDRLTVHNADAGLHVATFLPSGMRDAGVVRRMAERELTAHRLSTCYFGEKPQQGLLLGFGGFDERQLMTATRALGAILEEPA